MKILEIINDTHCGTSDWFEILTDLGKQGPFKVMTFANDKIEALVCYQGDEPTEEQIIEEYDK